MGRRPFHHRREIAVAVALSFVVTDAREASSETPFDLLLHARTVHRLLRRTDILRGVLDGAITHLDDLDPFSDPA